MKSIQDLNLKKLTADREYTKSPEAWEEQILYFLVVDRFANGETFPLYNPEEDYENALETEEKEKAWQKASYSWNGGNLDGLINKLDYLKELGITAIWISPIFKQAVFADSYHGYGIQNFLEVDPHFGRREDLKKLVAEAHARDIYIILDVIVNHAADVFAYKGEQPAYEDKIHEVKGFRNRQGEPEIDPENPDKDLAWSDGGIWPEELFELATFSRKGYIKDWDNFPEYIEGDFFSLKHIDTGTGKIDDFRASDALRIITETYKYWIAYADIDGFRLDTVKHMYPGATRYFATEIKEFAYTLGKKNFYIVGEITGGMDFARDLMDQTGLSAALGINEIPRYLEEVAKGYRSASDYFSIFTNFELLGEDEHKWYQDNVITMFDDHDMVYQQSHKERFAADKATDLLLENAIFLNLFTAGIPCMYYGTEQAFDGNGDDVHYVREAMFGGDFGAFRSQNRSFFNQEHQVYKTMSILTGLRKNHTPLETGRQYLREIANEGENFHLPDSDNGRCNEVIGWSRIFSQEEYLLAINCNLEKALTVRIMIDSDLQDPDEDFICIYSSNAQLIDSTSKVQELDPENYFLEVTVPAAGQIIYKKNS